MSTEPAPKNRRFSNRWLLIAGLGVVAAVLAVIGGRAAWSALEAIGGSSAQTSGDPLIQRNSGGGIDVTATLVTRGKLDSLDPAKASQVDFANDVAIILSFTTHEGDLTRFDFAGNSFLESTGGPDEKPLSWVVLNDDAHHLEGMLVFARQPRVKTVLAVRGLGGVKERLFEFPGQD